MVGPTKFVGSMVDRRDEIQDRTLSPLVLSGLGIDGGEDVWGIRAADLER